MTSIIDADTERAHQGIQKRAEEIQRTLFLDRDDEQFDAEKFVNDMVGS
jgi:hypothetical protein